MKETWFTADQHFYDDRALAWGRKFASVEEMNATLIEYHNTLVKPVDDVYVVGDFAYCDSERKVDAVDKILNQLNGYIHLIAGAHDFPIVIRANFRTVERTGQKFLKRGGNTFILNHHPMISWSYKNHGSWHLHGHCHGNRKEDGLHRRIDVGVDAWDYRPINMDDLIAHWETQRKKTESAPIA